MKRAELVRHLERHGCELLREGGAHTVYVNRAERKVSTMNDSHTVLRIHRVILSRMLRAT